MKGLKTKFFLLILSFCFVFKTKSSGPEVESLESVPRVQFDQYRRQVALLRQKVELTRQFNDSIMAMEQILNEELFKIAEIDDEISREQSLERLDFLSAQREEIVNKIKPAVTEHSRLQAEMSRLVAQCLTLNQSVEALEKALTASIYQESLDPEVSDEPLLEGGSEQNYDSPVLESIALPEARQDVLEKVAEVPAAQSSVEAEFSSIQRAFEAKMQAINRELSVFVDKIYQAGQRNSGGQSLGQKLAPEMPSSQFYSGSVDQQTFVFDDAGQGKRKVLKKVVVDDNGKRFESTVSGTAEKNPEDEAWKFKMEQKTSAPGQEVKQKVKSGSVKDLKDFDRQLSDPLSLSLIK